jgi:hypothetical protein
MHTGRLRCTWKRTPVRTILPGQKSFTTVRCTRRVTGTFAGIAEVAGGTSGMNGDLTKKVINGGY